MAQKASRFTGTGVYAYYLAQTLLTMESDFEFNFLVLKGWALPFDIPDKKLIEVSRPAKPQSLQEIYDIFNLKKVLKKNNVSLFHSMVPGMVTPSSNLKVVVTVHDIIPDVLPAENTGSRLARLLYKLKMQAAVKASHIMSDSNATKIDLGKFYDLPDTQITTVYLGSQFLNGDKQSVKATKGAPWNRPYLLYLGGFNYRKNVLNIIKAYAKIMVDFPDVDLVMVGKPAPHQVLELKNLCNKLELGDRVVWLGFIADADLPNLYAWCEAFVYPSYYEGFGLPVLEAMQFGAPVITSNKTSIPEIIGDAGIMVNPEMVDEIADAMKMILVDKQLQNNLIKKGEAQAAKFSWTKCADEVLQVYHNVFTK